MGIFDIFKKPNNGSNPKTAEQRKKQTEKYLKSLNIPFIDHLPLIEEESEVKIRTAQEIAERILVLVYLAYVSEVPDETESIIDFLKTNSLWDKVSPDEKELFQKEELTEQETANISWRSEGVWLLLWTIKKVDKLELPTEQVQIPEIVSRLPEFLTDPTEFIKNAKVRRTTEILDESDLIYRLHWATRNSNLNNQQMPANLDLGIIMERHYAINWVTFYADEWDEISTDT
ncbi:DUF4272 domain-containing protein [Flavobacterium okayamense]|uniref:DUF4272 domain-containing protein n=1 Tax=Flavobacterium okayamense TaxID=2830782 RepID=A0ABN6HZ18_9FLAO|nr:DUF4272 domain-containing protein [Flavobacterium okayamense]BCY29595.1 hypothetical protein KK2020170_24630 [Flavobacterium okayamense]